MPRELITKKILRLSYGVIITYDYCKLLSHRKIILRFFFVISPQKTVKLLIQMQPSTDEKIQRRNLKQLTQCHETKTKIR